MKNKIEYCYDRIGGMMYSHNFTDKRQRYVLSSDYEKLEGRYCRVIEECIEKDKQIALYKSREKYLLPKFNKVVKIMKSWKSNRIGRDYQTLKDIQEVII